MRFWTCSSAKPDACNDKILYQVFCQEIDPFEVSITCLITSFQRIVALPNLLMDKQCPTGVQDWVKGLLGRASAQTIVVAIIPDYNSLQEFDSDNEIIALRFPLLQETS